MGAVDEAVWDFLFGVTNGVAVTAWIVLAFLPRGPIMRALVLYAGVGILCLIYAGMAVAVAGGWVDPDAIVPERPTDLFDYTVDGLRWFFMSDAGIVVGWTHYLAFDLFVGAWIAGDADHKGIGSIWQVPILVLTFLSGPIGLLLWLIVREPAARRSGRPQ